MNVVCPGENESVDDQTPWGSLGPEFGGQDQSS